MPIKPRIRQTINGLEKTQWKGNPRISCGKASFSISAIPFLDDLLDEL
jgi:hypothetical protein